MKSARFQRALTIGCVALVALVLALSKFLPDVQDEQSGSTLSSAPAGRRALLLVLRELGYVPESWSRPPGALPRGAHVLWMAHAPAAPVTDDEEGSSTKPKHPHGPRTGLHAPGNYLRFVEAGGTLILPWREDVRAFLAETLELSGVSQLELPRSHGALTARHVRLSTGTELVARLPEQAGLPLALCDSLARPLWLAPDESGGPDALIAATITLGNGRVVLLADDAFASNAELGAEQDGELCVRLLEEQGPLDRLLFDEYALGAWAPESASELALSAANAPITLHLALILVLLAWMHAWSRAFPRDPEGLEQLSPLSRAQAQANILERARRFSVLAGFARRGALTRLQRAVGLVRTTSESLTAAQIEVELERAAVRGGAQASLTQWKELWLRRSVRSARELERLQRELDACVELAQQAGRTRRGVRTAS